MKNIFIYCLLATSFGCVVSTPLVKGLYVKSDLLAGNGYYADSTSYKKGLWMRYFGNCDSSNQVSLPKFSVGGRRPMHGDWIKIFNEPTHLAYDNNFVLVSYAQDRKSVV